MKVFVTEEEQQPKPEIDYERPKLVIKARKGKSASRP